MGTQPLTSTHDPLLRGRDRDTKQEFLQNHNLLFKSAQINQSLFMWILTKGWLDGLH